MSITSEELARICNVSRGTVDRALNNRAGISSKTKDFILEAAKEHGYVPHLLASSLATGKSHTIGIIVFDLRNPHFTQLVSAVEQQMSSMGFFTYICISDKDKIAEQQILCDLISRKVDGIILTPINNSNKFKDFLRKQVTPIVTVSNHLGDGFHFVGGDIPSAVNNAMHKFIQAGYKKVYFLCPPLRRFQLENITAQSDRAAAYTNFIHQHPEISGEIISNADYMQQMLKLIKESHEKIGIFCSSDYYALKLYLMAQTEKLTIPDQFGLMGFDGIDTLDYLGKRPDTICYPAREIGTCAARTLYSLINKIPQPTSQLLNCPYLPGQTL